MEAKASIYELLDLEFGKCRFALAGIKGKDFYDGYNHKVIASKYPNVTKDYFNAKGIDVEVVKIDGSVELAPILSLSDVIVDIVETGATLKENDLEVFETIIPISARLISNKVSFKFKTEEIEKILEGLKKEVKND
jgi:ATP phosphoribosyltransferase